MEKIKLVIWDLDETFWKGTLSEGEVKIQPEKVEIIKELTRRGIVNSISSKNDYEPAKAKLIEAGVWDYFIFPSINWNPKGENVRHIISECQLRAPNILFIDDNISNRKEVEHYNGGINTMSDQEIGKLLDMPELKGKDDSSLSRLKQYKILEKKSEARTEYSDNRTFLRESAIRIRFVSDVTPYKERILELINRTNQLNFTKIRLDAETLETLLNDEGIENTCIEVRDKFGDYGICGFYSLDRKNQQLRHFLFSCRILNLGIETYVYNKIGCPNIKIALPVAGELHTEMEIDWITEVDDFEKKSGIIYGKDRVKVLLLGGCDLEQMCHYIDADRIELIKEFNYPNSSGVPVHKEHTCYLRAIKEQSNEIRHEIEQLSFGDERMFETILFSGDYDVLVYSVLMNYTQDVYQNIEKGYKVAYGGYATDETAFDNIPDAKNGNYSDRFTFRGKQTPEEFMSDLEWLSHHVSKPIIFINGAEVSDFNPLEPGACIRHKKMNAVLDEFIGMHSGICSLLDVRTIVKKRSDNKDNLRHYQRPIYIKMAEELMTLIEGKDTKVKSKTLIKSRVKQIFSRIIGIVFVMIKKILK